MPKKWLFPDDRFFDPDPLQKKTALEIYERIRALPIVSPHGHVDANLFADPAAGLPRSSPSATPTGPPSPASPTR